MMPVVTLTPGVGGPAIVRAPAGPGEPLLVAAGLLASKGKLDLATMLLVAWVAATIGGVAGWVIGMKAGRAVVAFPGPFRAARVKALEKGETVFQRYAAIAVMLS